MIVHYIKLTNLQRSSTGTGLVGRVTPRYSFMTDTSRLARE